MMGKYMLDTNCFDYLLDNNINIFTLSLQGFFYTTNVQYSEILNIPVDVRRKSLLNIYQALPQEKLLLRSGLWIDDLKWDDKQIWLDNLSQEFKQLSKGKLKRAKDALIAELAKINDIIFVSSDIRLISACNAIKISTTSIDHLTNLNFKEDFA